MNAHQFPCQKCGADLAFEPGTSVQKCAYCGHENPIVASGEAIEELDYQAYVKYLAQLKEDGAIAPLSQDQVLHCNTCGADISLPEHTSADECAYCGSHVVVKETKRAIKPKSLLPFGLSGDQAKGLFKKWLASRWFAPGDLKKKALAESGIQGIYIPYWTFDSQTTSRYRGQRGDNYFETEHYTEFVDGKPRQATRQVMRTSWRSVRGIVRRFFDDVLVLGSRTLPRKFTQALEPWDLKKLVPYDEKYLSGFRSEIYQVGLKEGFANAHQMMEGKIRQDVRRDIGGDHQRIHSLNIGHANVTFKHVLLPIWISAYRYRNKVYRFLVNGRTGEVQGERPYSVGKILLAVSITIGIMVGAYFLNQRY